MDDPQQSTGKPKQTAARVAGMLFGGGLGLSLVFGLNDPADPLGQAAFLPLLFLLIPVASFQSYIYLKRKLPVAPKRKRYLITIATQLILLVLGMRLAFHLAPQWFRPVLGPPEASLIGATVAGAAMLGAYRKWKQPGGIQNRIQATLLPTTAAEILLWIPVALLAGTAEEVAYRGVAVTLVFRWTGSMALAVGVSVEAFGLAHVANGGRAVLGTVVIGLTMQLVFILTGTLYLPMLVHAIYDLLLGVMFLWMVRRAPEAPQPAPLPSG
jgi:membrane protease YdiL (CAAX protease family)